MIIDADFAISLFTETKAPYFNFGGDEEARDADELQRWLEDISLRGHEAIEVVLGQVVRLPMQFVHLAHLRWECNNFFSVLEQIIFTVVLAKTCQVGLAKVHTCRSHLTPNC